MNERKIMLFIILAIAYCMYSIHVWFIKEKVQNNTTDVTVTHEVQPEVVITAATEQPKKHVKRKIIPQVIENSCSVIQIFTDKLPIVKKKKRQINDFEGSNNTIAVIGMTVFLMVLTVSALLDVLKAKENERAKRKLNPDGHRRQSLAEFANKKTLRRESSKFGQQLFQIAESFVSKDEGAKPRRQARPYNRGDSTNSYLSETTRKTQGDGSAPASISETSTEPKLVKRQSVAKLIGARPAPMVRRSSFPALPQNPEVQALMLGHRQQSFDSDDEDGRGRRVRIIRRY